MPQYPRPTPIFDNLDNFDLAQPVSPLYSEDLLIAQRFLKQYDGNNTTFVAYRREIERLMQWAWVIRNKSIINLDREDIETYIQFCIKPPKTWIGLKSQRRFIEKDGLRSPNPAWRPFVVRLSKADHQKGTEPNKAHYKLSQKAIREIFTVTSSFYNTLLQEGLIKSNPVALIKQKSRYLQKQQQKDHIRRLTDRQWQYCLETAKLMADKEPKKYERLRFIITALYLMYLRISELTATERWQPQMGHFYQDSQENWWFKTVGKGNKLRNIAVSDEMLEALMHYREKQGLPPLPYPNDPTPLITKLNGHGAITSDRQIRRLVQTCFDQTIERLNNKGFHDEANSMEQATVHWLRHTGISDDINKRGRPVAHVRDDAGHESIATTDRYNDIVLQERHQSAKHKSTTQINKGSKIYGKDN